MITLEQKARDLLARAGVEKPDPQSMSAGEIVEVANLYQRIAMLEAQLAEAQKDAEREVL